MGMRDERGAITLEACISVTVFMLIMLFMSSIFVMFKAQHATAHALLEATQSLSVDAYAASKVGTGKFVLGESDTKEISVAIGGFLSNLMGNETHPQFATNETDWLVSKSGKVPDDAVVQKYVKERFFAYLGEDADGADTFLKSMHVDEGKDGLSFADTYISNGVLHVTLRYKFEDSFMLMGMKSPEITQTAQAKLWL